MKYCGRFTPILRVTSVWAIVILDRGEESSRPFIGPECEVGMKSQKQDTERAVISLPNLRFEMSEAARILRISRAHLYNRLHDGSIRAQKDGARTYITHAELERYVESCNPRELTRSAAER